MLNSSEIPQIVNFYNRLSDMIVKNGDYTLHSGELMNQSVGTWFKYQRNEAKCFKEAHWLRDESFQRHLTTEKNLLAKKEATFKKKDVSKWEIEDSKLRIAQDHINDKDQAFKMMFPTETSKVAYLAEESAFFTNQTWREARRVIMLDYAMGREQFVDMGEQMHRHIYELNMAWGGFLDFYTDLNNARKEKDDSFAEQNYIGEEIIEPDEHNAKDKYNAAKPSDEIVKNVEEHLEKQEQQNLLDSLKED